MSGVDQCSHPELFLAIRFYRRTFYRHYLLAVRFKNAVTAALQIMDTQQNQSLPSNITTEQSGNSIIDYKKLDKGQLIDLLQSKTNLLITASVLKLTDKVYVENLRKEVVELQQAINNYDN